MNLHRQGLDFEGDGYFVDLVSEDDEELHSDPHKDAWLGVQDALVRAKNGDFTTVAAMPDRYHDEWPDDDPWLLGACYPLLGHAATPTCFTRMRRMVEESRLSSWDATIDFCLAIAMGDTLSAVPLLLKTYITLWELGAGGVEMIPHLLCHNLEAEPRLLEHPAVLETGPPRSPRDMPALRDYQQLVMARYAELTERFGTDEVHVYRGELTAVVALAKRIRRDIARRKYHNIVFLRGHFEASTGVDCRGFFERGSFQPIRAAAIVDEFLKSPYARTFEPGVRYFFGHRIPE